MGIRLINEGDSGSVDITLNYVLSYAISHSNKYAVKSVPGATSPTVDTDTYIKNPTKYTIRARVTDAEKAILLTLSEEIDSTCLLTDNELTTQSVRPESVNFDASVGNTTLPWIARIALIAEDH